MGRESGVALVTGASRGIGPIIARDLARAGRVSFPYPEAYAAAKAALIGFPRVLRNDYRARGGGAAVWILGAIRDAGQGARTAKEAGLKLPSGGTSPAGAVGRAVLTAIL